MKIGECSYKKRFNGVNGRTTNITAEILEYYIK
jgi:hypothetical protein